MNTRPDPDLAADLALLVEHIAAHGRPLCPKIGVVEVCVDDVRFVHDKLAEAGWFPGARVESHPNVECAVVTFVFDEYACPIEDVAESICFVTGYSTTVADERDAPPLDMHRSYNVIADAQTRKLRAVCSCEWRSDWLSNGGLCGAAWDAHIEQVSK